MNSGNSGNFHDGFAKTLSSFCPRNICPTFNNTLRHAKTWQLTQSSNIVSTTLSKAHLSFKFPQVKKSDSYKILSQLTFIIEHALEYYI